MDWQESGAAAAAAAPATEGAAAQPAQPAGEVKSRRVYVGNLDWGVAWQDLKDHMRTAGNVVYADVFRRDDGKSMGCGIVEYETVAEAATAISTLTNTELQSRLIFVREDREDKELGGRGRFGGRGGGAAGGGGGRGGARQHNPRPAPASASGAAPASNNDAPNCRVFVSNLAWKTSWQDLKDTFKKCGNVIRADVLLDDQGRSRGSGVVTFETAQEAQTAIREFDAQQLDGRQVFVRLYT